MQFIYDARQNVFIKFSADFSFQQCVAAFSLQSQNIVLVSYAKLTFIYRFTRPTTFFADSSHRNFFWLHLPQTQNRNFFPMSKTNRESLIFS
jgi:hypothetical protein